MKTKKILLVTEYYPPPIFGGGEIGAQVLANTLHREGFGVTVLTSLVPGKKEEENEEGVRILRVLKTGDPRTLRGNIQRKLFFARSVKKQVLRLDAQEAFDTIHFLNNTSVVDLGEKNSKTVATLNSYHALCPKANLFYKEKMPCTGCSPVKYVGCITCSQYVGRIRLSWYLRYNPLFWLWNYRLYVSQRERLRRVGKKIVFNTYTRRLLQKKAMRNVEMVPNFTMMNDVTPAKNAQQHTGLTVTYIGNLEKMKGIHHVLQAYAMLKEQKQDVRFIIAGSGSYAPFVSALAERHRDIVFKGAIPHDDVGKIYAETDVVVIPSLWPEPFSRVLLEAYNYGKPVIATAVGGNKDYVKHGETGYLIDPTNAVQDMVAAIIELKNKKRREVMGKKAQAFYQGALSPAATIQKLKEVYNAPPVH